PASPIAPALESGVIAKKGTEVVIVFSCKSDVLTCEKSTNGAKNRSDKSELLFIFFIINWCQILKIDAFFNVFIYSNQQIYVFVQFLLWPYLNKTNFSIFSAVSPDELFTFKL
ncbi:MAG: hypothetical protein RIT10_2037, partial [Bacteroidota bacterium]